MLAALAEVDTSLRETFDDFVAQRLKTFSSSSGVVSPFRNIHFDAVLEPFKNGSSEEQYELARIYLSGDYTPDIPKSYAEAIKYAQSSWDRGFVEAANLLASIYASENEFKDVPKAIRLLEIASADSRSAAAQYNLALIYRGDAGEAYIDVDKHIDLLISAAELNSVEAVLQLGLIAIGSNNVHEAYEYFAKAKELGSEKGALALEELMQQVNEFNQNSGRPKEYADAKNVDENVNSVVYSSFDERPEEQGLTENKREIEGVTKERLHPVSDKSELDSARLAPIFEGELDRGAMATALKKAMEDQGLSVRKAAGAAGVSFSVISQIKGQMASIDQAAKVLDQLGYEIDLTVRPKDNS